MQPDTSPIRETVNLSCTDCGGDVQGNRLRCPLCVRAAIVAIEEAAGQVVTPSMIAAARERLG